MATVVSVCSGAPCAPSRRSAPTSSGRLHRERRRRPTDPRRPLSRSLRLPVPPPTPGRTPVYKKVDRGTHLSPLHYDGTESWLGISHMGGSEKIRPSVLFGHQWPCFYIPTSSFVWVQSHLLPQIWFLMFADAVQCIIMIP